MENIHFQHWACSETPKACLVLVHGAGEHIGRYEHFVKWFLEQDIAIMGGDLPGLGRSAGRRGHVNSFDEYTQTVKGWLVEAQRTYRDTPIFLLGHSMGGLVAARLLEASDAAELPIQGALLSSPCLRLKLEVSPWKQMLAGILGRVAPTLRLSNGIDTRTLSRSPEIADAYASDPYVESQVSVRWFHELQKAMRAAILEAGNVRHPIFLMQAGADHIVDPEIAAPFFEKISSFDKNMKVYPGFYHELLNEPEKQAVFADIQEWILARI